ncbi:sigma-70 family RNA polymerase sigma factor [Paenibacillus sp. XY044]|uniref:sigma-70 family RNA polymerase sigma factor n=1 Tax=Paenibacillus sp. XY044 TaxID=2026089 RepID=UPI000B9813C4|nr:sigma-70 family RNA polymerase sigma factor [Paenibacillus sp. XY044]OZB95906.1 hypothetical protein CJP46_08160 [Paenibacillus sp. XY044]
MLIRQFHETEYHREDISELYPSLKKYCLSVTRNHWDAEDLAHDTIDKTLRFCLKDPSEQRQPSLPLMMTIARNHWIDLIRKRSRESAEPMVESQSQDHPIDMLLSGLDTLMEKLTPKQLLVFVLKDVFESRVSDIASMLELNETTVKSLLHRARRNLSGDIGEAAAPDPYWKDVEQEAFRHTLLTAIRQEKPEMLQRLMKALQPAMEQAPVVGFARPRMSSGAGMSLRCAA